jgi:putative ABC transport system permease protein
LFAQLLTESLVLAALGGALGVFFALAIIDAITLVMPPVGTMIPSEADIRISIPVLFFTIAVTTVAGLLFGAAPAWQATRLDLNEILQLGGRSGSRGMKRNAFRALMIAEFSLALTLLATGGLALRGFWNLNRIDLGIQTDNVLTFRLPVPDRRLDGPDQIRSYYGQMLERIQVLPGVTKAALTTGVPGRGPGNGTRFTIVGQPANAQARLGTGVQIVTPEYVDTLGVRMVSGRNVNEHDTANGVRVITVNEYFVKQYLAGVDPLTQRISFPAIIPGAPRGTPVEWQIVGVYHNLRGAGFREDNPEISIPFAQNPLPQASIALKTSGDPRTVIKSVAAAVTSVDPDMPLAGVQTIDEIVSESLAIDRFSVVLFASFGALGLILAAVGIYGVMAFAVAQRTHEFGVRMALGAQRTRMITMVLKEGTVLAITGTLIGLGGGYLVGRAMQSTLYGVDAFDVRAFIGVSVLLLAAALLACWFPAWRASRVEPLEALRYE